MLQGCERQRLDVRVVDSWVADKIQAADPYRLTERLQSALLQALTHPCFIRLLLEMLGGEPLGCVPLQLPAAA